MEVKEILPRWTEKSVRSNEYLKGNTLSILINHCITDNKNKSKLNYFYTYQQIML